MVDSEYGGKGKFFVIHYKGVLLLLLLAIGIFAVSVYIRGLGELDKTDAYGNTPLMEAVKLSDVNRVTTLIERGANVDTPDGEGDTPLIVALRSNHDVIADILLENGADVNVMDRHFNTPLMLALKASYFDMAKKMIEMGANVNVSNDLGEHPLTVALQSGHEGAISMLMEAGADLIVRPLGEMPVGTVVRDITTRWRFREGVNYSGRTMKEDHLEWLIISQDHFGKGKTLLLTEDIIAMHVFDPSAGQWGGRDSWHNCFLRSWLADVFYLRLSGDFKKAIVPTETVTSGFSITDERIFLLSQVELNLGNKEIIGDHGKPIDYFSSSIKRIAYFLGYSHNYWTRSAEAYVDEDYVGEYYKSRYRVRYVAPGGEISSEYPLMKTGGVRPATNLKSEILVTTYKVDGSHVIVWASGDLIRPYLQD